MVVVQLALAPISATSLSGCCGYVVSGYRVQGILVDASTEVPIGNAMIESTAVVSVTHVDTPLGSPIQETRQLRSNSDDAGSFAFFWPIERFFTCSFLFVGPLTPGPPEVITLDVIALDDSSAVSIDVGFEMVTEVPFNEQEMLRGIIDLGNVAVNFSDSVESASERGRQ